MKCGFLIFPGVEELDFVGPWEMASMWAALPSGPQERLLVAGAAGPVVCAKGLSLNPHATFDACPALDLLVVPGGIGTRAEVDDEPLIDFIRRQAGSCRAVLSVCTGAFLLQRAGLLDGKRATTHWASLDRLRALGVQVVEERFVRDGAVWTSAGVSAGIDMTLAFIADFAGEETAARVQLAAEYFPSPRIYMAPDGSPAPPAYAAAPRA